MDNLAHAILVEALYARKFGERYEWVHKRQDLRIAFLTNNCQ